jgi:hypothetical protein
MEGGASDRKGVHEIGRGCPYSGDACSASVSTVGVHTV